MPRIFTTNSQLTEEDHILPRRRNAKQQHAIDRRYVKGVLGRVSKGAKRPAAPSSQAAAPPPYASGR